MTSTEELKLMRLFRVYNTCIQLCSDRGYTIRHPSALAAALSAPSPHDVQQTATAVNPNYNAAQGGLSLEWFRQHFVVAGPDADAAEANPTTQSDANEGKPHDGSNTKRKKREADAATKAMSSSSSDSDAEDDEDEAELLVLREAMRITGVPNAAAAGAEDGDHKTSSRDATGKKHRAPALMIFFTAGPLSLSAVQTIREKGVEKKTPSVIIVAENRPRPAVYSRVEQLNGQVHHETGAPVVHLQLFCEEELVFNPSHNSAVPPHRRLSEAEKAALLRERRLEVAQLPRIFVSDPMVMYLGLRRGDVVEITRATDAEETRGPYLMYRQVL
ncbi:DNA-directed RNA polymerases I, II, and III subunit RPABC1 [Strigomonas culicis]|uniref:DNA-directed RNA polymerases I, II, and III subunit RPABC1 n=1 Tax=Strigomonas culicis TaxID=28005 RepID=S9UAW9_9TRYP|nr:DNA-directed RNA polymerases I, II, and III subunit RPABC1 [Strigomonas culicis]EPY30086.1 DNA-directed RNA polymerases I, II, and III subunit RPABC1 [Strigomonas culicis]|eukprot:EPY27942.1 DNA-directed RNA polymerases I, II, and III subunit RPABC1 [Strigomonas culicis]